MTENYSTALEKRAAKVAYHKAYYQANREKLRAQMARHYQLNPDAYKERARQWEQEHPERRREVRAAYRAKYADKLKEGSRIDWQKHNAKRLAAKVAYRAKCPEMGAHFVRLRQTRKQQATPLWADLAAVKLFHNEFNLRVIPAHDNQSKGNKFINEASQ